MVRGRWIQVGNHEVMEMERCEVGLSGGGRSMDVVLNTLKILYA